LKNLSINNAGSGRTIQTTTPGIAMAAMKWLKHRKHHVQNATKRLEVGFLNGIKPIAGGSKGVQS